MLDKNHANEIQEVESKLEKAETQNDRKEIKRLLNGIWWQFKEDLASMPTDSIVRLSSLLSKYQEFGNRAQIERFREKILNRVTHVDDGKPKDPNRIMESLQTASVKLEKGEMKVAWSKRMVRRANGTVEEVDNESK